MDVDFPKGDIGPRKGCTLREDVIEDHVILFVDLFVPGTFDCLESTCVASCMKNPRICIDT